MHPRSQKTILCPVVAIVLAVVCSVVVFLLCYLCDNKYLRCNSPDDRGVVLLTTSNGDDRNTADAAVANADPVFLVYGWELYRGLLLKPTDFDDMNASGTAQASLLPEEFVAIGEYPGFEGADPNGDPHGSATYRINISIPDTPSSYSLALPEIYSACRVYINGIEVAAFGDPSPSHYRAATGERVVSFLASKRVEIVIAATDYSHVYSGLVYPPAFGLSSAVDSRVQARLFIRMAVIVFALLLAVFFLAVGLRLRQRSALGQPPENRLMLLFGILCLCFVGYTVYPLVATLTTSGMWKYTVENLCFVLMVVLVVLLSRWVLLNRTPGAWAGRAADLLTRLALIVGIIVVVTMLLRTVVPPTSMAVLAIYSLLMESYKWLSALALSWSALQAAFGRRHDTGSSSAFVAVETLSVLIGILVFDVALIMDRLFPVFEPILTGWFTEIAGFALLLAFLVVVIHQTLQQYRQRLALEEQLAQTDRLIDLQRRQFPLIIENAQDAREARHDLRHHLNTMQGFAAHGDTDNLLAYLSEYSSILNIEAPLFYSSNPIVDVVLRHFAARAQQADIEFSVRVNLPETLPIKDPDLSIILNNLLENALEACAATSDDGADMRLGADAKSGFISISLALIQSELVIQVENRFSGLIIEKDGHLLSRKHPNRLGIGTATIRHVAERAGGGVSFNPDPSKGSFRAIVNIPLAAYHSDNVSS